MVNLKQISLRKYNMTINTFVNESVFIESIYSRLENIEKYPLKETLNLITPEQIKSENLIRPVFECVLNNPDKSLKYKLYNIIKYSSKNNLKESVNLIKTVSEKLDYPELMVEYKNIISCERVLNNHKKLNEYSNIDFIFSKYNNQDDEIIDSIVVESCDYINDYNMNFDMKLTVALENINYGLELNNVKFDKDRVNKTILEYFCLSENFDIMKTMHILEYLDLDKTLLFENNKFDKVSQSFKDFFNSSKDKSIRGAKAIIKKLYTDSPQNIIDDLPNILRWIRKFFIFGSIGVNAPVGIVLFATDSLIELKLKRKDIDTAIKKYKKEKDKIEDKMYSVTNKKTEEKYKKLNDELDKSIEKLETYKTSLYSDKENEEMLQNEYGLEIDINDIDLCESYLVSLDNIMKEYVSNSDDYEIIFENFEILNEKMIGIPKKAKVAGLKIKKNLQRLSDKDKIISDRIDSAYERMRSKLDMKSTNRNREAVIKGSILPSFSSLVKLALGSAAIAGVINPVLGAISFLGALAVSKKATNKERKYILDEIEIQLEVISKKISLAESNNDMKALEQLLRLQRKLKQERQRIIYKGRARNFIKIKDNN